MLPGLRMGGLGRGRRVATAGYPDGLLRLWSVADVVSVEGKAETLIDPISGEDLTQAVAGNRPVLNATGGPSGGPALEFAGAAIGFTKSFTRSKPFATVALVRWTTHSGANTATDGVASGSAKIYVTATSIRAYGGGAADGIVTATISAWNVVEVEWNGATSNIRVNDGSPATFNAPTVAGGVKIGPFQGSLVALADCEIAARADVAAFVASLA